ncbi:hypothetical protein H1R20_g3828, partial [Candolleomyces eurysporus]
MATPADHFSPEVLKQRLYNWSLSTSRYTLYKGLPEKLGGWLIIVERACRESGVPLTQRTEAALLLIVGELADVMQVRQQTYLEKTGEPYWGWQDFKQDLRKVVGEAKRGSSFKYWLASAAVGLIIAGSIVLIPAVGILILNAVGFTAGGVAAGSLAALIQAVFFGASTGALELILGGAATGIGLAMLRRLIGRDPEE